MKANEHWCVFQVIAFLHTVLSSERVKLSKALVVCPLNTVLNWQAEFDRWQSGIKAHKLEVSLAQNIQHSH